MSGRGAGLARRVRFRGQVERRHEAEDLLEAAGDVVLVHRGRPRSLVFACPDGCGSELTINLDERVGRAWRLYRDRQGMTLYPSVWRDSGCEAHFIVWRDQLIWCGRGADDGFDFGFDRELEGSVLRCLGDQPLSAEDLARLSGENPWEVARAADRLVAAGKAKVALTGVRLYARLNVDTPPDASPEGGRRRWQALVERILGFLGLRG